MRAPASCAGAFALLALLLTSCGPPTTTPQIKETVVEVEGFAFESGEPHLMGPDYLTWNPYRFFTFEGETWEMQGHGAVTVRAGTVPTRYRVQERVTSGGSHPQARLLVVDQSSGRVLAERDLLSGFTWDGKSWRSGGWEGDEARKWLTHVLAPSKAPLPEHLQPYYSAPARVELAPAQIALPPDHRQLALLSVGQHSCNGQEVLKPNPPPDATGNEINREFKHYRGKRVVQGDGWRYIPNLPLHHVACLPDGYVALSLIYGSSLTFDLLDKTGHVTFRSDVSLGTDSISNVVGMDHVQVRDGLLQVDLAYAVPSRKAGLVPQMVPGPTYRITIAIDPRTPDSFCAVRGHASRPRTGWCLLRPPPTNSAR